MAARSAEDVLKLAKDHGAEMVDFTVVDLIGRRRHVTIPASQLNEEAFTQGTGLDTSSYAGYKRVEAGDARLVPDPGTAALDPFTEHKTLSLICSIREAATDEPYARDPRGVATRAQDYLQQVQPGARALFSPELEFNVLDDVRYASRPETEFFAVDSDQAAWNTDRDEEGGNLGYKPPLNDAYHASPPTDVLFDLRSEIVKQVEAWGVPVKYHHHENAGPGQLELEVPFGECLQMADSVVIMKYIIRNVAHARGKTATFMPKPMFGVAGNGMHVHQYLADAEAERSLFWDPSDEAYAHLSELAGYYVGGLLTHAPALLAFTSPSTNSFKRLVPGYEAPVSLFYALGNRTAAIRIPAYSLNEREHRIEFRPPDATCNPYLCLSAMLMAGLDGIAGKIGPAGRDFGPFEVDIATAPDDIKARIKSLPASLELCLDALDADRDFLTAGGVFSDDLIDAWIEWKLENDCRPVAVRPVPYEYVLYYDL
jgi:glutamine synthetase